MKTLNKILAAAVTVFTVSALSSIAVYAANVPKFSLNEAEAAAGEEVTLTFECSGNPGITAWKVEFDYDHDTLELISFDAQGIFEGIIPSQTLNADPFVMSWSNDIKDISVNGKIADINFKVKESATDGEYPVKITYDEDNVYSVVLDSSGIETNVHFDTQNGLIKVKHNHDYTLVSQKAATCTAAGEKVYKCSKCGNTKTETIKATGHKYTSNTVAPTASAQGYTLHTCSICGHSYKDNYTDPISAQLVNNSGLSATSIELGDTIQVTADAEGGSGSYQYQVVYKQKSQSKWTTAQAYNENTTVTLKPANATEYDVCVKVKDSNGTEVKKFFTVSVTNQLKNISTISKMEINLGDTVKVTAKASGGTGSYQYNVLYKQKSQSKWTTAQAYQVNADVSFKPAKATEYDVCVKVKDSKGTEVKKYFTVKVNDNTLTNISTISAENIALGDTVTVNAKATGSTGFYLYAVYYKKASDTKWVTKQDFKSNSIVTIKPSQATTYDICVKIKDDQKTIVKKYFTVNVTSLTNTSTISSTSIKLGDTIKVSCSAEGSTGFYKYAVYYKTTSDEKWTTKQNYSANSTITIKPTKSAKYNICVKVMDNQNNIEKKYFEVTVK